LEESAYQDKEEDTYRYKKQIEHCIRLYAGSGTEVHISAVTFMEERKLSVHWITIVPDFAVDNNSQNPLQ
jgi:ethanolamine utilization cobalamin adenosyltransferase